ncbi:MAG: hypothetical protein HY645_04780 [Acidobacteria bacterium]|nr:hypothetical protein [Acidobacteriota bacterium]
MKNMGIRHVIVCLVVVLSLAILVHGRPERKLRHHGFSRFWLYPSGLQNTPSMPRARLFLRELTVSMDSPISVPVYFEAGADLLLKSANFTLTYPKETLNFIQVEPGVLLPSTEFAVKALGPAEAPEGRESVQVTVSTVSGGKTVPNGLLVYLRFSVHERKMEELRAKSQPGTPGLEVVHFRLSFLQAETIAGESLTPELLAADSGLGVTLLSEVPVGGCFFYMH